MKRTYVRYQAIEKECAEADGSSNNIIKCCSPVSDYAIPNAFNRRIQKRITPKCLKVAKVILIYRKQYRSKPENY